MTTAAPTTRPKRTRKPKAAAPPRLGFAHLTLARACEASAPGEAPTAFRILAAGTNETDKGPLVFTPRSARLVMDAWKARGNPLALYYEHEDRLPLEKRGGAPMRGACSAPSADLAIRGPAEEPECWAENVAWTEEAKRQIKTGERRQISPVAAYDEETREVLEILNVSLCGEGATHHGTLLASRDGGENRSSGMDELESALAEAIASGDYELAEEIAQKMEAMEGYAATARMAKLAVKCAKDAAAPPPPPAAPAAPPAPPKPAAPTAATQRLAANRDAMARMGVDVGAFDRAVADLSAAAKRADDAARRSDRATVTTLIAANRDAFDIVDERQHREAADPAATQRHIDSFARKVKAGEIELKKPGEGVEAKPGGKKPGSGVETEELTPAERVQMDSFNRSERDPKKHLTPADIIRSRTMHGGKPAVVGRA